MRISKAMAKAGLCSRRDAERWIAEGRVVINGEKLDTPAREVGPQDRILIDGQPMPHAEPTRLWRYSKPKGLVTTHRDPEGRPTVFDGLPDDMPRVMSIGRLDYNTEGLLLLTTDGELARYLELPATGWLRRYRVRAHGRITQADLDPLREGIEIEGVHYGPIEATLDSQQGANVWLTLGLREGKNREVRKILASLGLEVNRLIRISFGPFQLLDLKPGSIEIVRRKTLIDQLGARLATQFNLADDTDEDIRQRSPSRKQTGSKTPTQERPRRAEPRKGPPSGEQSQTDAGAPRTREVHRNIPDPSAKKTVRKETRDRLDQRELEDVNEDQLDDIKPWDVKPANGGRSERRPAGLGMKRRRTLQKHNNDGKDRGRPPNHPDKK
jgi:23S rRNA pseudouridine2605 synthase